MNQIEKSLTARLYLLEVGHRSVPGTAIHFAECGPGEEPNRTAVMQYEADEKNGGVWTQLNVEAEFDVSRYLAKSSNAYVLRRHLAMLSALDSKPFRSATAVGRSGVSACWSAGGFEMRSRMVDVEPDSAYGVFSMVATALREQAMRVGSLTYGGVPVHADADENPLPLVGPVGPDFRVLYLGESFRLIDIMIPTPEVTAARAAFDHGRAETPKPECQGGEL